MKKFDQVFVNGNFYSQNREKIEYIGVKDGKISEIGNQKEDYIAAQTINLHGKPVYPGFSDAHLHLVTYAQKKRYEVSLSHCSSKDEMKHTIDAFIKKNKIKPNEWVIGAGWDQELFPDKGYPDKLLLDDVSTDHPMIMTRACYHICVVNSKALKTCEINGETVCPEGGKIDKDINGNLTGILRENAMRLITAHIPSISSKGKLKQLILEGCKDLAAAGVTTIHTDDFSFVENKKILWEAYKELAETNQLPIHIVLQLRVSSIKDIYEYMVLGFKSCQNINRLRIGPIKIISDGSLGSRTAALDKPYSDDENNTGILLNSEHELERMIYESFKNNFDISVHAIGDRAMRIVLNIFEKHELLYKAKQFRPSIIHCQIGSKKILERFKKLGVIANIQPAFIFTDWDVAGERVGDERLNYSYCYKKYMDHDILCVGSSDAPIESFNPLYGIYAAVNRKDLKGMPEKSWMPEERINITAAIKMYTLNTAFLSHEETTKGSLEVGRDADFVVLSDDLLTIPEEDIKDIRVESTYVNGELIDNKELIAIYA